MTSDTWTSCYVDSWKGIITPESFAHPAKMSRGLLHRIFDHAFKQGWVKRGDTVVDPFGGIGSTGIEGAYRGLQVICCELEPRFVVLAQANVEKHRRHWTTLGCPQPVMLQGDSRKLTEIVQQVGMVVGSPPYVESPIQGGGDNIAAGRRRKRRTGKWSSDLTDGENKMYGAAIGQLAVLPPGSVQAVIGSPPHLETRVVNYEQTMSDRPRHGDAGVQRAYGTSDGQLGQLPPGQVACVVSSPPFESSDNRGGTKMPHGYFKQVGGIGTQDDAGFSSPSLANQQGNTFWSAARTILEQTFALLPPGGHAIWVTKMFVKNKQLVDFPGDWRRLCEAAGFRLICEHRAMLTETWEEPMLFEGLRQRRKERKSFFRRLAEKKGSPRIDWETVMCVVK